MAAEEKPRVGVFTTLYVTLVAYGILVPILVWLGWRFLAVPAKLPDWVLPLVLVVALGGMASVVSLLLSRRFVAPLQSVVAHVRKITGGDLAGALDVRRDDELGQLSMAINEMTAHLRVAQEARVDRQYLQQVIDSMPDGLLVVDRNGVVHLANAQMAEALGHSSASAMEGLTFSGLVGRSTPGWFKLLLTNGRLPHREVELNDASGAKVRLTISGQTVQDVEGVAQEAVLLAKDAEELRELAAELRDTTERLQTSESYFQNLFDAMNDPITVLAPDGQVLQANRAARATFGQDLIGKKCYRAFRMRDEICEGCPAMETLASRAPASVEHRIFGNAITQIDTYPLLGPDGEISAIINHKRDVTKERLLDDLKANFLAAVSHELRTPLTSIIGFNKLNLRRMKKHVGPALEGAPDNARSAAHKVYEDLVVVHREGERLRRLVNDLLDLSKLDAGKLELKMEEVVPGPLVDSAVAATSSLWKPKSLEVQVDVPADCPAIWADPDRVSQVLVNLLSNAIKFTDSGGIAVQVALDDRHVRFSVADSGPGIPPDELATVFEKFRQVQGTESKGTGLGLPICKQLVRLHAGRIWVDSVLGEGSTFHFTIPRADLLDAIDRSLRGTASLSRI